MHGCSVPGGIQIKPEEDSKTPADQALHWLIILREEPDDPQVKARFDAWLMASLENRKAWREAEHVWDVLGEAKTLSSAQSAKLEKPHGERSIHGARRRHSSGFRLRARHAVISATSLAAVLLVFLFQPAISIWLNADYSTSVAETREIRLEDGSIAYLGADSAIEVSFGRERRSIRLLSGEAYFEVTPDSNRPFQVAAGDVESTVLGTAFDVSMLATGVAVAVNHGSVGVASPRMSRELDHPLGAGDWVRVAWTGEIERGNDAPELAGGWRDGMLVVKDRAVTDVLDELRRHYRGVVMLAGGNLDSRRVTGVYNLREPLEAFRALAQAHGATVRQISPWVVVISGV